MIQDAGQSTNHKILAVVDPKYTPSELHREVASDRRGCTKHELLDNLLGSTKLHKVSAYEHGIYKERDNVIL